MKVFIENEFGSDKKNLYNEKILKYQKTVIMSKKYPYPYGFIINTTSGDGDNLDCFVITDKKLKTGEIIDVEPIGLMEQTEDGNVDNNILAILPDKSIEITDEIKQKLTDFVTHVFDHIDGKVVTVGNFFGKQRAIKEIKDLSN